MSNVDEMVNSSTGHGAGCPCHVCEREGTLIDPLPVARESQEFKEWFEARREEFQTHMAFATQAFHVLKRDPPSPQYEILAASVIAAMRVREYKRNA